MTKVSYKKFNFKPGKLYEFNGKYRLLYAEKNSCNARSKNEYKIRKGDKLLFLDAELEKYTRERSFTFYNFGGSSIEEISKLQAENLKKKGMYVTRIVQSDWDVFVHVYFRSKWPLYTGRIRVAYKDIFGWVNIKMLSRPEIIRQFSPIDLD